MKKGNILDIGIKAVKDSGKTNMYDREAVKYYAFYFGFNSLVSWLVANEEEYISMINCIDFEATPALDSDTKEMLLENAENENDFASSLEIRSEFHKEIEEFREVGGYKELKQLPFTFDDFFNDFQENGVGKISDYLHDKLPDHAYNYLLPLPDGNDLYWFDDYFYILKSGKFEILSTEQWIGFQSRKNRLGEESQCKFDIVDEQMRLAVLLKKD
ncbi:DUF5049 domain-containing protein [Bacillus thuringiensis]|uniref:DUF5049 domain-containing protein n=1 Tax=Bacillus thuringiensis TaxID=1428 RepID=UPI0021D654A2|nr:DUF5049 domain-containing protein [Bacillus thuringiensis]MCU7667440.1 DUF5049 domain-containing protein [Bacillus thuringiensis]